MAVDLFTGLVIEANTSDTRVSNTSSQLGEATPANSIITRIRNAVSDAFKNLGRMICDCFSSSNYIVVNYSSAVMADKLNSSAVMADKLNRAAKAKAEAAAKAEAIKSLEAQARRDVDKEWAFDREIMAAKLEAIYVTAKAAQDKANAHAIKEAAKAEAEAAAKAEANAASMKIFLAAQAILEQV